jgi:hypothetical protein
MLFSESGRLLRLFSGIIQILFQLILILSGNYGFFNYLTIVLCISLFDDCFLWCLIPQRERTIESQLSSQTKAFSFPKIKPNYIVKPRKSLLKPNAKTISTQYKKTERKAVKSSSSSSTSSPSSSSSLSSSSPPLQIDFTQKEHTKSVLSSKQQIKEKLKRFFKLLPSLATVSFTLYVLIKYCNYQFFSGST